MSAGSAEPDRHSEAGKPAAQPGGKKGSHPLAETTVFGLDSGARLTQAGAPRMPSAASSAGEAAVRSPSAEPPEVVSRFRIEKLLGRGGMASVYLARDIQLDRPVALKIPRMTDDPTGTLIPRFFREARTAATLNHPNICPIYDVGQDGDTYFIAMGLIEGRALTDYISSGKRQPDRQVAIVIRKVALALEHAHARGILHRDLKPANIMIDHRGEPIVMDFGLACRLDDHWETRLTQDGAVIGTPNYMAPEQIDSRSKVGPASDVYSLGVALYELLTGQCPFTGSLVSVIGQVLHSEPKPVTELRPDVSPALAEICSQAMAKNPLERFASMKEFAQSLSAFLKGEPSAASSARAFQPLAPAPDLQGIEALLLESGPALVGTNLSVKLPRAAAPKWPRGAVWGLAAGAIAVVIAVVSVIALAGGKSTPPSNAPAAPAVDLAARDTREASSVPKDSAARAVDEPAQAAAPANASPPTAALPAAPEVVVADDTSSKGQTPPESASVAATPPPGKVASSDSASVATPLPNDNASAPPQKPAEKPEPPAPPASADRGGPPPGERPFPRFPHGAGEDGPGGHGPGGPPADPPAIDSVAALEKYFREADHNGDGKLDPAELPMHIILRATKNKSRSVSLDEMKRAFQKLGSKLFAAPTAEELRKLPKGPPQGPPGGPGPPPRGKPR